MHSLKAGEICRGFVANLQLPTGVSNASCTFLGVPKACPPCADGPGVGRCLAFSHLGGRKNFVLVAHVEDHEWLCHGGNFIGDCATPDPFSQSHLVLKDVQQDAWDETIAPRRKIAMHAKTQQLTNQIQERSLEFCELVACATFQAEEIRAARAGEPIDLSRASAMYEKNPFKWQAKKLVEPHRSHDIVHVGVPRHNLASPRFHVFEKLIGSWASAFASGPGGEH